MNPQLGEELTGIPRRHIHDMTAEGIMRNCAPYYYDLWNEYQKRIEQARSDRKIKVLYEELAEQFNITPDAVKKAIEKLSQYMQ